ncbi:MAG: hypothetical protein IIT36_02855, partial [Aeriscardovia sp.]|nr:hypothetical protein [Aeriscardovia sp.]
ECSVCHMKQNENTVIPATGEHTFAWVTDLEPTEIDPGEKHESNRMACSDHLIIEKLKRAC